jgi:hypothetical protein
MIASGDQRLLISSMGWIDHDSLWVFDVPSSDVTLVPLKSGARYLSLHCCHPAYFAVVHHFDGPRFEVTVRGFGDPGRTLAQGTLQVDSSLLVGDPHLWKYVPRLYVEYLSFTPWNDFVLLAISPATGQIEPQRLEWYNDTYDKGYQGVTDVLELPDGDSAIVTVQRSSNLILHDLRNGTSGGTVELAGRGGNPHLCMRREARELWASDYDSLVVLDPVSWRPIRSARFQTDLAGIRQFIGEFSFDQSELLCALARPFSGDVLGVNPATLEVASQVKVGGQPLEVALTGPDQVVARDWKSGTLLRGQLARRRWWSPI